MKKGDKLIFYVGENKKGYKPGVYASGEIISDIFVLKKEHLRNGKTTDRHLENKVVEVLITDITYDKENPFLTRKEYEPTVNATVRGKKKIYATECYPFILNSFVKNYPSNYKKTKQEDEVYNALEGEEYVTQVKRYKRSQEITKESKRIHGTKCQVCGFDFEETYGELGKDYIIVHHLDPVSKRGKNTRTDAEKDTVCLCSNCHDMIHRREPP